MSTTLEQPGSVQRRSKEKIVSEQVDEAKQREQIAKLAYQLWQERGCPQDSAESDWIEAEQLFAFQSEKG
jgi:hypothetical protein